NAHTRASNGCLAIGVAPVRATRRVRRWVTALAAAMRYSLIVDGIAHRLALRPRRVKACPTPWRRSIQQSERFAVTRCDARTGPLCRRWGRRSAVGAKVKDSGPGHAG